ncbi:MAG: SEC-C metal-binding domain-containing protein, partial [Candidatus Aenigmatarchaeota archaeon]
EDDLMRLFGNLNMVNFLMNKLPEDQPIEHPLLNNALAIAQKRVEAHNFEIRKQLLEYDNVMNEQREVIYKQRRLILEKENIREEILEMIKNVIEENIPKFFENEDTLGTVHFLNSKFCLEIKPEELQGLNIQKRIEFIKNKVMEIYQKKELEIGKDQMFQMEKNIALWVIDSRWKEHLLIMDSLKEGIYLRGYAQTEPLVEYQKESHIAFTQMISNIKEEIVEMLFKTKPISFQLVEGIFEQSPKNFIHSSYSPLQKEDNKKEEKSSIQKTPFKKIGRNEPCPCGSGKKYKKCCGR